MVNKARQVFVSDGNKWALVIWTNQDISALFKPSKKFVTWVKSHWQVVLPTELNGLTGRLYIIV